MTKIDRFVNLVEEGDDAEAVERLLEAGCCSRPLSVDAVYKGWPLLCLAIWHERPKIAELLLSLGANVNQTVADGRSPLHLAIEKNWSIDFIDGFIGLRADVNKKDRKGVTPLWLSSKLGCRVIAEHLLDAEADPNMKSRECTPIYAAVGSSNVELVELLACKGARVDVLYPTGSLLHAAVCCNDSLMIEALCRIGVPLDAVDSNGRTAYQLACLSPLSRSEILGILERHQFVVGAPGNLFQPLSRHSEEAGEADPVLVDGNGGNIARIVPIPSE